MNLQEFRNYAVNHNVIPVYRRVLADGETPLGIYKKLAKNKPGTFLLESAEHGGVWSRYSFIGVASQTTLTEKDGLAHWLGTPPAGVPVGMDPLQALKLSVAHLKSPVIDGLPPSLSALPEWSIHLGQLFIGISLGTRFTPTFLRAAPRFMISVMLCTVLALFLAAGFGWLLALVGGIHPATAILATSPGGIAEMSLTAKTLQLGVPIVTTFHVTRMAVLVLTIGPLFRMLNKPA